ncbi:uncharacterized protein LOC132044949 [Lycium ferocissimum]|uniref:uncharacterized protein LOC132044949 n=1 Tax=Lycium ferocissimum TaxID=112874 RepID=UPI002815DCCC|nr:uncharacterized protein LOC132044949 [Lycium ferocissimum]
MEKAYDRVSWLFFIIILHKMGFSDGFVDMIWRLIANNWYSVLISGQLHGFFHSTRGVKQGDPLSVALFILSSEVLTRALNSLFDDPMYRGFGMPKWSADLNHLAYEDDTIIFSSADKYSLKLIMEVLLNYETVSGKRMKRDKSCFCMYKTCAMSLVQDVAQITGFTRGEFPFKYLGCPIFHSRKKKAYYNDLIKKVKDKLQNWKGKLMSFRGKAVLIKSNKEDKRNRHWASWLNMCYPRQEGGMGFRSLFDVSKALFAKLWWRFRTSCTLWSTFMWNKYCKRIGPLVKLIPAGFQLNEDIEEVNEVMTHGTWNFDALHHTLLRNC